MLNKNNKLLLLAISCMVILGLFSVSVFAKNDSSNKNITKINEYQSILDQIKFYKQEKSYSKDLNDLINLKAKYINHILEQKKLSEDELKNQNYTNDQIYAIKHFDGSDAMALRASAYVYVSGATMTKTSKIHGVRFSWHWMGTPFFAGPGVTDGVAVRWQSSNSNSVPITTNITSKTKVLVDYGNNNVNKSYSHDNINRFVESKFSMGGPNGSGGLGSALHGIFDVYVSIPNGTNANIAHTNFRFVYAHSTLNVGSISFSYPLGISINVDNANIETTKDWEVY